MGLKEQKHTTTKQIVKSVFLLIGLLLLSACAAQPSLLEQNEEATEVSSEISTDPEIDKWGTHDTSAIKNNQKNRPEESVRLSKQIKAIDIKQRMLLKSAGNTLPIQLIGKRYSFSAKNTGLRQALNQFAVDNALQIIVDQEVDGQVFVDFKDQPLEKAIELILGTYRYHWQWDEGILKVSRLQTKTFVLDYLRLTRSGNNFNSSVNAADIQSPALETSNNSSIQQSDSVAFWDEIESQLNTFVSNEGRLVINRLSGTIQITDTPARIEETEHFIQSLQKALHRQVVIDARILEVSLRDDSALGIDWNKISINNLVSGAFNTISSAPVNGIDLKANTVSVEGFDGLLAALNEQGNVRIVSQPRIRTLNNQPSLIKVGTDKTFFTKSSSRSISLAGLSDEVITEKQKTITEGLVLSLTPQISQDRWVMLDISPIITRVLETTVSSLGSTAPVLDIKQASTLVRARDGEMIVLGGLIQDDERVTERSVPILSDIPLIGQLFRSKNKTKIKKELVIFLVPRIVI